MAFLKVIKAKEMYKLYFVTMAFLLLTTKASFAQLAHAPVTSPASSSSIPTWMTETWIGNGRSYQQTQNEVKTAIKMSSDPLVLVAQYKANAQQHMADPMSIFRWAFVTYCVSSLSPSKTLGEIAQARQALAQAASPRVYEFARLRFALDASAGGYIYPLKPIGERLLQKNPKDDVVKFWLIQVLDDGLSDTDKQKALVYSQQLIQAAPQKPYGYNLLGWTYLVIFLKSHQVADGDKAISAYRQSLQRTPSNNPTRPNQERLINLVQTMQKNSASNQ